MGDDDDCKELATNSDILYFLRNICSPRLAELLAREFKNSKFIKDPNRKVSEGATDLLKILNNVNNKGKRDRDKLKKKGIQPASDTYEINNLDSKENKAILEKVKVKELLEMGQASEAVTILGELDVKFLLCVLVNCVLGITFNAEVKAALNALRDLRNSHIHQDGDPKLLQKLWKETELVEKYLRGDTTAFKELKKKYCPEETWYQILEDVRKEIDVRSEIKEKSQTSSPRLQTTDLTIRHHQEDGQPGTAVPTLLDFLVEKRESCWQEPRPIVLYGEPGAGKSFVLDRLLDTLREQNTHRDFKIVVKVKNTDVKSKDEFWKQIFTDRCPQAIQNHKEEEVKRVLRLYARDFLFLVDCNLQRETLDKLISYMCHGLWVLSFQGKPDYFNRFHLLEVEPLSEKQIHQVLQDRPEILRRFKNYEHKDVIKTPEMVRFFADICPETGNDIPFYKLIRRYIDEKVKTDEEVLIDLGKEVFDNIKKNKKYYTKVNSALYPLFNYDHRRGYFFKYRKVEVYLAAMYVVAEPEETCKSWLSQATLFETVFHVVCFLWSDKDNGIKTNDHFIREYLKKVVWSKRGTSEPTSDERDCKAKKRKQDEATSEGKDCKGKKRKSDTATSEVKDCKDRKMKKESTCEGKDCVTIHKQFERWICLSKFAKDYQSNEDLLRMLAAILTPFDTWRFRYTTLTQDLIDSLSQMLKHVELTRKLTIKMESGTNIEVLTQLWTMLRGHSELLSNTSVHLTIRYQDSNVAKYEGPLAAFCEEIDKTTAPLYITQYTGPLLCSSTPQFFKALCLQNLVTLDVYITDLDSLSMVLAHNENRKCLKRLRVRLKEITEPLEQSQSFPPDMTIMYFDGLQKLLDSYKPDSLCSLKIHEVYIHDNFHLDLTRFTKLELLSIRFVQKEEQEKVGKLSREEWLPRLVKHLRLPTRVGRLLMRNMAFLDDSSASALVTLCKKVAYQRLVLLDTDLSIAKFREIMVELDLVTISRTASTKDAAATPPEEGVRRPRLQKEVREDRRKHKPEGKELIVTSQAELYKNSSMAEEWPAAYHNFVNLVKDVDSCSAISINYSGKCVAVRKDVCGDLFVNCPLPFLDDTMAEDPEQQQELVPVLKVLALAERISLHNTMLSYNGTLSLLRHLKERMKKIERTEPFKLIISSRNPTNCFKTKEELLYNYVEKIDKEDKLAQFSFSCNKGCHYFKKAASDGSIYFNDERLIDKRKRAKSSSS